MSWSDDEDDGMMDDGDEGDADVVISAGTMGSRWCMYV